MKANSSHKLQKINRRQMLGLIGRGGIAAAAMAGTTVTPTTGASPVQNRAPSLDTRLTRDYGVRYPFVSAGMGFVAYPPLVTAVSNAGGLGVLGAAIEPPPSLQILIQMIKAQTNNPFGVDFLHDQTAFGPAVT